MRQPFRVSSILVLFGATALSQTTQGLISGRIVDSVSGQPVAAAEVRCDNDDLGGVARITHSGLAGYFLLPLLSPGPYRIRIEALGYQPQEIHRLDVPVAGRLDLQIYLRLLGDVWEAGQYRSMFLPRSGAMLTFYGPDVDTSRSKSFDPPPAGRGALAASVSQVVDPAEVRDLPLAGRDIYTTLMLQPGVTAGTADARGLGLAVAGQRPTSSNFLLDGADNNNYLVTGPLMVLAPESVQEYRISTNNFSAEYGGTSGVLANAVTRAGGNTWHGIAYFDIRNDVLNANDFQRNLAALARPPLREIQPGFQTGGPVLHNRLFSSSALEYLHSRGYGDPIPFQLPANGFLAALEDAANHSPIAAQTYQLLLQHPFPVVPSNNFSAPVTLSPPDYVDRWLALERIDSLFGGGTQRLMARFSDSHLDRPDFLWSPYRGFDAPLRDNTLGMLAALTSTLSPSFTTEARLAWSSDNLGWDRPYPGIPTLESQDNVTLPGSPALYSYRNRSRPLEVSGEAVWSRGPHLLQFGGGMLIRAIDGYLTAGRDGRYTFGNLFDFAQGTPSEFSILLDRTVLPAYQLPNYDSNYRFIQFHAFAQDTFRVSSRLVLNYGLRYENFGAPDNTGTAQDLLFTPGTGSYWQQRVENGALELAGARKPIYSDDNRGWAARLGGSYDLTGRGDLVLRGGYGIFYNQPFENLWENVRLNDYVLETFDVPQSPPSYLSPVLPQLSSFPLQPGNSTFPAITWVDTRLRNPYVQSFFLGVQEQVASGLSLEVNGTGSLGRKSITTDVLNRGFTEIPELGQILYRANQGDSDYAALGAVLRYRTGRAQFQAAYTWSHSIDNQSSPLAGDFFDLNYTRFNGSTVYEPPAGFTIEQNSRFDRGNSDFDQRRNLVFSGLWNLPEPASRSRWLWLARNWRLAGLASFRTGFPYTVFASNSGTEIWNQRANLVGFPATDTAVAGGQRLLSISAFANPSLGVGDVGRNSFSGPGLMNLDVSLNRSFALKALGEAGRINIRADIFNFLNHANLGNPDPLLGDATFGVALYGRKSEPTGFPSLLPLNDTARQTQLMVRIEW